MANPLSVITKPLSAITSRDWKSPNGGNALQGIVKRDWVPTGRIDFATKIDRDDDPTQPGEFKLLVEERRIIESVAGNEHLEISMAARHTDGSKSRRNSVPQIPNGKLAHQICI